jgi:hypothetical protein
MDAETEKRRFGAKSEPCCLYVRAKDSFHGTLLQQIVAEVGLSSGREAR